MPSFRQARGADSSLEADMMSTFALGQMLVRRQGYGAVQLAGPHALAPPPDRGIGYRRAPGSGRRGSRSSADSSRSDRVCVQNLFNLADQRSPEVLEGCRS